jgi:transposase
MGRPCVLVVEAVMLAQLERLSRSGVRGEADRARAVVAGRRDQRLDRGALGRPSRAGAALALVVPAGRSYGSTGPAAVRSDAAQAGGSAGGGPRGAGRVGRRQTALDPGPAGAGGHGPHWRDDLFGPPERGAAKRGYRWRRPRHSLKGRQEAAAVDRAGLRLGLLRQQALAGDVRLLFGDESEVLTHPYLAHCWAKRGADLRIEAPGQAGKRALLGVLDHASGELIVITSATKRSDDFIDLLGYLDRTYAPQPGQARPPLVLVLDNGPIHTSKASTKALAARPWLKVEWLPRYAPELNEIEHSWRDLKRHYLAQQTFRDLDHLDNAIHAAVRDLNQERRTPACAVMYKAA